jgi:uracil-DNA glycosylase family 4
MKKAVKQYLEQLKLSGINEVYIKKSVPHIVSDITLPSHARETKLSENKLAYMECRKCPLWSGRKKFVYGEGNPNATCMVIGEGPGEQENLQGRPFVGPAGQLLDKMLLAIKINRADVYIANIVKCRPPGNRNPEQSERLACLPYLNEQISIIQPKVFLLMGLVAAQTLLETKQPMHWLREQTHSYLDIPAYVTYHPSALLRNPNWKKPAWEDLQKFQIIYENLSQS